MSCTPKRKIQASDPLSASAREMEQCLAEKCTDARKFTLISRTDVGGLSELAKNILHIVG